MEDSKGPVEAASSSDTEPTEYLRLGTDSPKESSCSSSSGLVGRISTVPSHQGLVFAIVDRIGDLATEQEAGQTSSSSSMCELEDVRNIEEDSRLFSLLRSIKDNKLENRERSEVKADTEVENITRNDTVETLKNKVGVLGVEAVEKRDESNDGIFTMTELEVEQDQKLYRELDRMMEGSVEELGEIMHRFELIEGQEEDVVGMATAQEDIFENQDEFEYAEVTFSRREVAGDERLSVEDQSCEERKTSFSSDVHIIVLQDGGPGVEATVAQDSRGSGVSPGVRGAPGASPGVPGVHGVPGVPGVPGVIPVVPAREHEWPGRVGEWRNSLVNIIEYF